MVSDTSFSFVAPARACSRPPTIRASVPSVPPRGARVPIAERDRNKPMLGKGKGSGSNRRNLGKRRKYNIAEEVTTFATPDERALAVKCTALAGSGAVGAGAARGAKTADAAGLFNEGVLDNVLTTDEHGKPLLQLQGMTTGPALNRFWETMSKGIYGPLHDGSGSGSGAGAGVGAGVGGTPATLPPKDPLEQPFLADATIDGLLKRRCGREFRDRGGAVSNKVNLAALRELLRKRVRDIELIKEFNCSGSSFALEGGLAEIRRREL